MIALDSNEVLALVPFSGITKEALIRKGATEAQIEGLRSLGLVRYTQGLSIPAAYTLVRVRVPTGHPGSPAPLEIRITDQDNFRQKPIAPEVLYHSTVVAEPDVCYNGIRQESRHENRLVPASNTRRDSMTATAAAPTTKTTKEPGACLFSGRQVPHGTRFVPGYDAKMKSALIRQFRGQPLGEALVSNMSPELRARFQSGDLSTSEGAQAALTSYGWEKYATAAPVKAKKQKPAEYIGSPRSFEEVEYLTALAAQGGSASIDKKHTDFVGVHEDNLNQLATDGLVSNVEGIVSITPLGMSALAQSAADEGDEPDEDEDDEE